MQPFAPLDADRLALLHSAGTPGAFGRHRDAGGGGGGLRGGVCAYKEPKEKGSLSLLLGVFFLI